MRVLLDNGHGENTPGKRSPDNSILEWKWNREVAVRVERILTRDGIDVQRIVVGNDDVPINQRVKLVNKHCLLLGAKNVLLVSIHINAAGNGSKWLSAHGWSIFVSNNASDSSKKAAECIYDAVDAYGWSMRKPSPNQKYWQGNLGMCRDSKCPAVLVENFFMDNKEDAEFLAKESTKDALAQAIASGIVNYILKAKS